MPVVDKSALVPYSAAQMYSLVNDIEAYPQFLPWCRSSRVLSRSEHQIKATIEMVKGPMHRSFTTCNHLQPQREIQMQLVNGPFRRLDGAWQFISLREDACKVVLRLEFEFANTLLRLSIGPIFNRIADTLVDSFCQRARQLYG